MNNPLDAKDLRIIELESQNKVLRDALEKIWCLPTEKQNVHIEARVICNKALSSTTQPQPQKEGDETCQATIKQTHLSNDLGSTAAEVTKAADFESWWEVIKDVSSTPVDRTRLRAIASLAWDAAQNDDSEPLDWQEKNKATVGWSDRCSAFIVQRKDQTVGHIGIGPTPSEAIRDAMKEGK